MSDRTEHFRLPPGALLAGFAASQFAVILTNIAIDKRSLYADLALWAASLSLPFLLGAWSVIVDSERKETKLTDAFFAVTTVSCLVGFLAIAYSIAHVNKSAGLAFFLAGVASVICAFLYENHFSAKRTWDSLRQEADKPLLEDRITADELRTASSVTADSSADSPGAIRD